MWMWTPEDHHVGNQIYIEIECRKQVEQYPSLLDPDEGAFFSLWGPDGILIVNEMTMTKIRTGVYAFYYQSSIVGQLGDYTAEIVSRHQGGVNREKGIIFRLVEN